MSLIKKVFITVTVIAAATMMTLLYFGLSFMRQAVREATITQQQQVAREALYGIDQDLYARYKQIQYIGMADDFSALIASPANEPLKAAVSERFSELIERTDAWNGITLLSASGKVVASSDKEGAFGLEGSEYHEVFDTALQGEAAYTDLFQEAGAKEPVMLFAAPVKDDNKADTPVVGVVIGRLNWHEVLTRLQRDKQITLELYNSAGVEIGDSAGDTKEILTNKVSDRPAIGLALRQSEGSITAAGVDSEQESLISFTREKGFREYEGNNWILTIETTTGEAFALYNTLARTLPFIFSGVVALAIIIVMFVLNHIVVRHVRTLTGLTQMLAAGDLTQRAHLNVRDEFGQLAESFNRMADKLQEMYRGLEAKIAEKTAQLAGRVRESETARARDEAILGAMGEGVIALDEHDRVVLVNTNAAELFGAPRDVLFGHTLIERIPTLNDDKDAPVPADKRPEVLARTTGQAVNEVYTHHPPDGPKIVISINATPILQERRVVGIVLVVRDVTKEKEVDRMKTEFISLASHQLRTPLSAIRWFSEMLISGDAGNLSEEQTEFAKNISSSTDRMIELVGSLLNISRIESGRIIVDPKPTDLNELVSGIVNDLHAKIGERQQNIIISVHQDMGKINLDPRLIGQVYLNLLTNAIKYTPKGGDITVMVSKKDDQIISQVSDTGYGIPKDQQEKVFKKFFRADNVAKFETDGTGLGLYLVKAIIESSGGKIWFESEEGKGTTFWFSLPASGMVAKEGEVTLDS